MEHSLPHLDRLNREICVGGFWLALPRTTGLRPIFRLYVVVLTQNMQGEPMEAAEWQSSQLPDTIRAWTTDKT